jgi:hypothetical protein
VGGVFARYGLSPSWSLQPEALFTMRGAEFAVDDIQTEQQINYLEVPVLVRFGWGRSASFHPSLFAGPSVAFLLKNEIVDGAELNLKGQTGTRDIEAGAILGAGLDYKLGTGDLMLDARYEIGLISWSEDLDIRNSTLSSCSAGFRWEKCKQRCGGMAMKPLSAGRNLCARVVIAVQQRPTTVSSPSTRPTSWPGSNVLSAHAEAVALRRRSTMGTDQHRCGLEPDVQHSRLACTVVETACLSTCDLIKPPPTGSRRILTDRGTWVKRRAASNGKLAAPKARGVGKAGALRVMYGNPKSGNDRPCSGRRDRERSSTPTRQSPFQHATSLH